MRRPLTTCGTVLATWLLLAGCEVEVPAPEKAEPKHQKTVQLTQDGPQVVEADAPTIDDLKGKPLPDFDLPDIQGGRVTKESLKGKVVLIDFWATWCVPCRNLSPLLQKLHKTFGPKGLVVLGANTAEHDPQGRSVKSPDLASYYAKDNDYSYTFLYGCDDYQQTCHVSAFPSLLLVDREGVVRDVFVGLNEYLPGDLVKAIDGLLR
jgi:thiol-disulfide isomerase/thioredoxin